MNIEESIRRAVQMRIAEVYEEETRAMQERIAKRTRDELGRIALSVLSHFTVGSYGNEIRITVRNDLPNPK